MDVSLKLENRAINPAVINLFQFENNTTTLNFVLDSYIWENSDLRNYKAYAISSINGVIDYTELEMTYDEDADKLSLSWLVQDYTLSEKGAITYQIVFKENTIEGNAGEEDVNTAVWYSYKAIIINRESLDGDNHIVANYPTILKQHFDKINELAGLMEAGVVYIPYGETIEPASRLAGRVYYQYTDAYNVTGRFEDHEGNILIDNQSLTAVELQPNVNLNDIRESGVYYTSLNTNAATMSNTPIKEAFYLEVISMDENLTKQVWTHFNTTVGDVYTRKYYRGTWGEWYKTATTKYVDGTFLPLKGGNLKGALDLGKYNIANVSSIELSSTSDSNHGGFIDFHYNGNAKDFTSRIMENAEGRIEVIAPNGIRCNNKQLVRTVGGVEADVNGNVEIDGMGCKAVNVLTTVEEDTIDKWCELGAGVYYFSELGLVSEQPSQYGFLINFTTEYNDVFQIWKKQSGGKMYYRSANANNWGESWTEIATSGDVAKCLPLTGGTMTGLLKSNLLDCAFEHVNPTTGEGLRIGVGASGTNKGMYDVLSKRWVFLANTDGSVNINTLGDDVHYLSCNADGSFTWDGKNVVRSINGELADSNGNVEVIAYDDMSFNGTELKLSKTNGTSTSVDLGDKFADLTSAQNIGGVKTFTSSPKVPTVGSSSNDTTAANTQWVTAKINSQVGEAVDSKFQVVTELPESPVEGVFYFVTE